MPRAALIEAVKANSIPLIQQLLREDKADLDEDIIKEDTFRETENDFSNTVVMRHYKCYSRLIDIACEQNHVEAVELLLREGSLPTKPRDLLDREDMSNQPLSSCKITSNKLTDRQYKILKLLILAGADLKDLPTPIFPYPIDIAIQQNDEELFDFLCAKGQTQTSQNNSKKFQEMSNPNNRLLRAVEEGKSLDHINLLINKGANLETVDQNGNTSLLIAAQCGQQKIVDKLIFRANNQVLNKKGHCLLHCAVIGGLLETVKNTLDVRFINEPDHDQETLLSLAINHGHVAIAAYLVDQGAKDLNNKKETLLHKAVRSESLDTVKFVLEKFGRQNLDAINDDGNTALTLAVAKNKDDIANFLLQQKANIFSKNAQGKYIFQLQDIQKKTYYKELMYQAAHGIMQGFEVEQDINLAEKYYSEAAKLDHPQAQFELAEFYRNKYDYFLAVKWQHRAALNNHIDAQCQYGKSLLYGMGISKNIIEAKQWLIAAANKGQKEAQNIVNNWDTHTAQAFKETTNVNNSDLGLFRSSKKPGKRIYVPDQTDEVREVWKSSKTSPGNSTKNEMAVNIGLICTDRPHQTGELYDLEFQTLPIKIPGKKDYDLKNLPINNDVFITHVKKRIRDGETVYAKYKASQHKPDIDHLNFFNRKHKDTDQPTDNNFLKHSEQCFYEYLNSPQAVTDFLRSFAAKFPSLKPGSKIYAVVLDFYSLHCMCANCKIATIGMQNPEKHAVTFLNNLETELLKQGYKVLTKPIGPHDTHLKMVTRIRYDKDFLVHDENNAVIKYVNCSERDIRNLDNMQIFEQKHSGESNKDTHTIFMSGT